jgi:uridine kinase
MESREVVLHKFVGIRNLLMSKIMNFSNIENDFMLLYYNKIENILITSELIDDPILEMINKYRMESMREIVDITAIIIDLNTGLQNEFLSKLFRFKVPLRQPAEKSKPVYKAGFVYIPEEDSSK